jgi:putative membrane protein insertion efficiency factor
VGTAPCKIKWVAGAVPGPELVREIVDHLTRRESVPTTLPEHLNRSQRGLIVILRLYQHHLSASLHRTCIFEPSCSEFAVLAIAYNGALVGTYDALRRWVRCRPSSRGGVDYPRGCDV